MLFTNNSVLILKGICVQIPEPIAISPPGFWLVQCIRSVLRAVIDQHLAVWAKEIKLAHNKKHEQNATILDCNKSRKRAVCLSS